MSANKRKTRNEEYVIAEKMLYQINLPYACYGIEVKDNRVILAPPIAKWMLGKNIEIIKKWVENKQGIIKEVTL